jgi:predicted methyltransferase
MNRAEVDPMKMTPYAAGLCAMLIADASLIGGYAQCASSPADVITSAVADPAPPEGDRNRDVARKPVESLQFSVVKPG